MAGTFPDIEPAGTRETFTQSFGLTDPETGEAIDLADVSAIVFDIIDPDSRDDAARGLDRQRHHAGERRPGRRVHGALCVVIDADALLQDLRCRLRHHQTRQTTPSCSATFQW